MLKGKLSGLDAEKKLNDLLAKVLDHKNWLSYLESDIDKLIQLAKRLDGYTSDDEEAYFVESLVSELEVVKKKVETIKESVLAVEKDILDLKSLIDAKKAEKKEFTDDEMESLISRISLIEEKVDKNEYQISEMEWIVDGKKQRFAEMDLFAKFTWRNNELNKLWNIVDERAKIVEDLVRDCTEDINDEKSADDLKEVCKEVIGECDEHNKSIAQVRDTMNEIKKDIETGLKRLDVKEMSIDELYLLLELNVEIKKKLRQLLADIDGLSKRIIESWKKYLAKKAKSPPQKSYQAVKGDEVDEMLAKWINLHGCTIWFEWLGGGFYMFGSKKIYAKIMNGKLVIWVGGGYMSIDEFMKHYGLQEMQRQQRMMLDEEYEDEIDVNEAMDEIDTKGGTVVGIA